MISIDGVSFSYKQKGDPRGVTDVNLRIGEGECVVLLGKSGSGKTTVTRLINGLIPHFFEGTPEGETTVCGKSIKNTPTSDTAQIVGSVFQNPRTQFFNVDVIGELAFGCENMALPREEILRRIDIAADAFNLRHLIGRSVTELSGGEKQRVVCGSVYAADPKVYIMDEPSSNLDASSVAKLGGIMRKLKASGRTLIVSEHRIHYLMDIADKFVVIENGKIIAEYTPDALRALPAEKRTEMGLRCLDIEDIPAIKAERSQCAPGSVRLKGFSCGYGKSEILNIPDMSFDFGETVGIIGENGTGKTTLVNCISGLKKHSGEVLINGVPADRKERIRRSFLVMQDVGRQLFAETLINEMMLGIEDTEANRERAMRILEGLGLSQYAEVHPRTLSGGQRQRTAVATAFSAGKEILFFDEPTSGLDYDSMLRMRDLIRATASESKIRFIITHDPELIIGSCTSVLHINGDGRHEQYALDDAGIKKVKEHFIRQFGMIEN